MLVRHGQSEWNLKNLFTGWRDVDLTEKGIEEAKAAGRKLKAQGPHIRHRLYERAEARAAHARPHARRTGPERVSRSIKDQALNERDYGDLTGLNKDDARKKWGEEQVHIWRRSYDVAPPGGESLKTRWRARCPITSSTSCRDVLRGERVLVSAHGNSLRALIMVLEG